MTDPHDRPRERCLEHGADGLAAEELVALVLGTGTRGASAVTLARELLARCGGLVDLARASPRELATSPGVGEARAARLAAAFALGRRALVAEAPSPARILSPADVYRRVRPRLTGRKQELFLVLALDIRGAVLDVIEVARGCLTGVDVHPREVFRPLIRQAAASAVAVHNHPSGDPTPSRQDVLLTRRLQEVGDLVGIPVLDHVVISDRSFVSIAEQTAAA